jgi:hypothetical protein
LEKEDLQNALQALDERDREMIQALTLELDHSLKENQVGRGMFGYWSQLELLAKLGIFINAKELTAD